MNSAIILAAGRSERMGGKMDKAFLNLGSQPVLSYSLRVFQECPDIDSIVLVVRKDQIVAAKGVCSMFGIGKLKAVVPGGQMRQLSVEQGLDALDADTRIVCVHDAARPCVTTALVSETIKSAKKFGSGVAATHISDTVKIVEKGQVVSETIDRNKIWTVQTPQTFKIDLLRKAFEELKKTKTEVTDESMALEKIGEEVHLVSSPMPNIKITVPEDLIVAASLLGIH